MKALRLQIYLASALICVSHHAFAEEGAPVPTNPGVALPAPTAKAPSFDTRYSPSDWGYSILAGAAGTIAGLAGPAVGWFSEDRSEWKDLAGLGAAILWGFGGSVGLLFGNSAGVYAYGELSGHSGNYWAALGGTATGMVGTAGLVGLTAALELPDESVIAIGIVSGVLLPSVFSTWFYSMTLESGEQHIPTGGLIDVDDGVVRLGVPELGVAFGAEGVERVDVKVLGARF